MRSILFFICLIFTFEGQAQEVEKSHMWKVELSGALNNNSAWEVEPSVTYLPIPYVGITMGLLFCNTIEKVIRGFQEIISGSGIQMRVIRAVISLRYVRPSS